MASTILIIEGDQTLRVLMGEILAAEGYDVRLAGSGDQALAEIDRCNPELVVLDPRGQFVDGREFLRVYRRTVAPTAPVLALSTNDAPIDAELRIPKPFNLNDFISAVQAGLCVSGVSVAG